MKVAIIADTHWGIRNDNVAFLDANKKFLDNVFFPELDKRGITQIFHLGDLVDKRKTINVNTAERLRTDFLEPVNTDYRMLVIAGNHDTYHKGSNKINSLDVLLEAYENIKWAISAEERFGCLFVPWICDENREETLATIKNSKAKMCFGHLELVGYQMYKGVINEHGDPKELFSHFESVFTGHFHHRSSSGNIHYLGSHGQFTWSDYNDSRGFHILDFEEGTLEFIPNPYEMFIKIAYDDADLHMPIFNMASGMLLAPNEIENKYVKVVIKSRTNNVGFDKFLAKLQDLKPLDIQVIDEAFNVDTDDTAIVLETQDTLTIFKNHIDTLEDLDVPKVDLERLFVKLYHQANEAMT